MFGETAVASQIIMPKLGMAMTAGAVVKWIRRDGESVKKGDPLVVVMSKKITFQVQAPSDGIVHHLAREKESRPVGGIIGYILAPGEAMPEVAPVPVTAPVEALPPAAPAPAAAALAGAAPAAAAPAAPPPEVRAPEILASPVARRLAREHGVDLVQVKGTGAGGRITERDVLAFVEARRAPAPIPSVPFAGVRQAIAQRMMESLQTTAQVTLVTEADVTETVELRERLRGRFDLTYTDIVVKAVARALRDHPLLNATLAGEEIQVLPEIHIGVAVALEDGLIVPVVRDADRKSLQEVAGETRRLAEGARAGTLTVDEVTGGTFTVTNLGMFEVDGFTPIINPPEAAILGVGRIVEKPAVWRGEIVRRSLMTLSLTFDHRLVDGAPAAAFLRRVKELVETPALIFAA